MVCKFLIISYCSVQSRLLLFLFVCSLSAHCYFNTWCIILRCLVISNRCFLISNATLGSYSLTFTYYSYGYLERCGSFLSSLMSSPSFSWYSFMQYQECYAKHSLNNYAIVMTINICSNSQLYLSM